MRAQPPGPPADGVEAAERPAEVAVQGIEEPKVPAGPMLREATAALAIPEAVDDLMREHLRFLYKEGRSILHDSPAMPSMIVPKHICSDNPLLH